jgi:hypothetical protein
MAEMFYIDCSLIRQLFGSVFVSIERLSGLDKLAAFKFSISQKNSRVNESNNGVVEHLIKQLKARKARTEKLIPIRFDLNL